MINIFSYYAKLQKRFHFQSKAQAIALIAGGALLSVLELVGVSAIFPLMLVVLDPVSAIHGKILGTIYAASGMQSSRSFAAFLALIVIVVFGVKVVFHLCLWRYEFSLLNKWRICISCKLFNALMHTDYKNVHKQSSAHLVNILTSVVPYVVSNYIHQCIYLFQISVLFLLVFTYMAYINIYLFVFTFAIGCLTVTSFFWAHRLKVKKLGGESLLYSRKLLETLQQSIAGFKETKIHQKESFFANKFYAVSSRLAKIDLSILFAQNLPNILVEFIAIVLIFSAFAMMLLTADNLQSSTLQISMIVILGMRLIPLVNRTITSLALIRSSLEPLQQLFAIYDTLPRNIGLEELGGSESSLSLEKGIMLDGVSFKYVESKPATLKEISLYIKKGSHIGIVGPSGSGKTTLINILLGFLTHYTGTYKVDDIVIHSDTLYPMRKIVSFVDQQPFILDGSFVSNVAYGLNEGDVNKVEVISALKNVGLWEHVCNQEKGLEAAVGENGKFLSGGQRQRLAIARALYKGAQLLILDEASSALDMESEAKLIELLDTLKGKITIISIAHRLSTLKKCDEIIFMQHGKIQSEGSFKALYEANATFKSYVDHSMIDVS